MGLVFGVKLLVWGKGPIRRLRQSTTDHALEQHIAELEARSERSNELTAHQIELLDDLAERLEFTERLLTRQRFEHPPALEQPEVSTPV